MWLYPSLRVSEDGCDLLKRLLKRHSVGRHRKLVVLAGLYLFSPSNILSVILNLV